MFKLFASIFGLQDNPPGSAIPDSLLKEAIERALDGTDPRMRILPGYEKTLRAPVTHAIEHVVAMVDALPPAVLASKEERDRNAALAAIFTSSARMDDILSHDSSLRDYLAAATGPVNSVTGLLVVERNEKTGFGYALVDDKLMNDVQQTTVSFDEHRLLDLTASEKEIRRLLRRRAFDYLLSVALAHVSEQRDEREKLTQQRSLLRVKLDILQKGGSGFSRDMGPQDREALQTRLEKVETELAALGPVHEVLQNNLTIVAEVLGNSEKHFWGEEKNLRIDQHYVLHNEADTNTPAITFRDVCDSTGKRATLLLLSIPTGQ